MKLSDGLTALAPLEIVGQTDIEIKQMMTDSRKVEKGTLFVALPGTKQDGRNFIDEAIRRGAIAILTEGDRLKQPAKNDPHAPVTFIRVADAHQALFDLSSHFFGKPAEGLRLVGITGTNGKTTTAFLVQSLLHAAGRPTGMIGTVHYDLSSREGNQNRLPASQTTPGILELQNLFSRMRQQGTTDVVMEVSSHSLDQRRVLGLSFKTRVFTNLTQDHLDYHKTMEAYFEAKKKLFYQTDGISVINIDDPWGRRLRDDISGQRLCYGIDLDSDIYPKSMASDISGIRMQVETPIGEISVSSPLTGPYNVYNLLGAIGAGVATGLSKEAISAGIAAMKSVPGRFEKIDVGQDFLVVVDYAHTEDALARLLQSVSSLALGHVITVFGCGGDRDRGKRPHMGAVASLYSRIAILTSDNPRSEEPLAIIREIETGMTDKTPEARYEVIPDRKEAIARAISLAKTGDAVVIAGKGHETVQIIGNQTLPFDDREVARAALSERV